MCVSCANTKCVHITCKTKKIKEKLKNTTSTKEEISKYFSTENKVKVSRFQIL